MELTMESTILNSISDIEMEQAYAEAAVLDAMAQQYVKMGTILEYCENEETIEEFSVFAESLVKKDPNESVVKTILLAIPRFIIGIIKMIGKLLGVALIGTATLAGNVALFAGGVIGTVITGLGGATLDSVNLMRDTPASRLMRDTKLAWKNADGDTVNDKFESFFNGLDVMFESTMIDKYSQYHDELAYSEAKYFNTDGVTKEGAKAKAKFDKTIEKGKKKVIKELKAFVKDFNKFITTAALSVCAKTEKAAMAVVGEFKKVAYMVKETNGLIAVTFNKDKKPIFLTAFNFETATDALNEMTGYANRMVKTFETLDKMSNPAEYVDGEGTVIKTYKSAFNEALAGIGNFKQKYTNPDNIIYTQNISVYPMSQFEDLSRKFTQAQKDCKTAMEKLNAGYRKFSDGLSKALQQAYVVAGAAGNNSGDTSNSRINKKATKSMGKVDKDVTKALTPMMDLLNTYNILATNMATANTMMAKDIDAWTKFYAQAAKIKVK